MSFTKSITTSFLCKSHNENIAASRGSDDPEETFDIKRVASTRSKFGVNPSKICWDTTQLSVWRLCCRFRLSVPYKLFRKSKIILIVCVRIIDYIQFDYRELATAVYLASFAVAYSLAKQRIRDMTSLSALAGFEPLTLPGHQFILVSYSQCWKSYFSDCVKI